MTTYKQKYQIQRNSALVRNIEWHFTYESWLAWWGDDIVNRGRKRGQLVMARYKDRGPYHPDNVRKATCSENLTEAHKGKIQPFTKEHKKKLSTSKQKPIKTPQGLFNSRKQCAEHYNVDPSAIGYWMKIKPTEYYYL